MNYSVLSESSISSTAINAALTYFSGEEAKSTLVDLLLDNLGIPVSITFLIAAMLFVILAQRQKLLAEKQVIESRRQVDDLSRRVYVDALTSVRNKGAFSDCIDELEERLGRGERPEFAVGVFRRFREMDEAAQEPWTQPRVSMGMAEYDPSLDGSVSDTIRRADEMMYKNKRIRKAKTAAAR